MRKAYIQPKTKVYQVSQQTTILAGSGSDASIRTSTNKADTNCEVEVKKEADFFWN